MRLLQTWAVPRVGLLSTADLRQTRGGYSTLQSDSCPQGFLQEDNSGLHVTMKAPEVHLHLQRHALQGSCNQPAPLRPTGTGRSRCAQ